MEAIFTEHIGPVTVNIHLDPEPMDPREWDHLGLMLCSHKRYVLGDEQLDPRDYESVEQLLDHIHQTYEPTVVLPLYLLDHSGLAMRVGPRGNPFWEDPQGWDSGQVGFIIDTADSRDKMGLDGAGPEHVEEILRAEVSEYNSYLTGMVYGFTVENEDGEHLDSCWGFFDEDDALSEGKAIAEHEAARIEAERKAAFVAEVEASATYAFNPEPVL